jgi:pilus assembly protein CpaE
MTGRILVFDTTGDLADQLREAVRTMDPTPEVVSCGRSRALGDFLTQQRFDLLVAGPGLDTRTGWERLRIIREEMPEMPVVLVLREGAEVDPHDVVRAGAVEILDLPLDPPKAAPVIERALGIAARLRPTDDGADGADPASLPRRVISVASASGGCGKTFLATNLAWLLHRRAGRRVCIVDLDLQFGEVASTLRLRPHATIVDLVQAARDGADMASVFEEHCDVHPSGISVLAAPRDPTEAEGLTADDVGRVIDAARRRFDDVVVDTPAALSDSVLAALSRSDELILLATLDVPSVHNVHVFLGTLQRLGVDAEGIRLMVNKAEADAGIEVAQVLKLFPQGIGATLPYSADVLRSVNAGSPVLDVTPEAVVSRRLLAALAPLLPPDAQARLAAEQAATRHWPRPWRTRRTRESV